MDESREKSFVYGRLSRELNTIRRCPHCAVANPHMPLVWSPSDPIPTRNGTRPSRWAAFACSTCGGVVLAKGMPGDGTANALIEEVIPEPRSAASELPDIAKTFLQQAYDTLHAPDAAAVMAGSAVDAMLKKKGYENGTLYQRIDKAVEDQLLTKAMGDWAHEVRLGANRPRHADKNNPHTTPKEARLSVEFAEALGHFLFVLSHKVNKGLKEAKGANK